MLRGFLCSLTILISACATIDRMETPKYAVRIENLELPLLSLQHMVSGIVPIGTARTSSNGREFTSKNFILDQGSYKPAGEAITRYWAKITVKGSQRPYAIEVFVAREQRVLKGDDFTYEVVGHDRRLAKEIADKIKDTLAKRREDRNIIDDFRVF